MNFTTVDDLNPRLFSIINELDSNESRDVIFLCKDFVPNNVPDLKHLITELKKLNYINENNIDLVGELLYYLKRYDLLKKHFLGREDMENKLRIPKMAKINQFRLLLYELSELVPNSEYKKNKNVFRDELSIAALDKSTSLLDVFMELEKKVLLDNLEYLKKKSKTFNSDFEKKLLEYEQKYPAADKDHAEEAELHSEDYSQASEAFYSMDSKERGVCLIINNFNFEKSKQNYPICSGLENRIGTEKDEQSINEVFGNLGFRIVVKNDLEGNEIFETVYSYSMENYEKNDCFICFMLSHGKKGLVYGTDGQSVTIRNLTSCFRSSKCPSLTGKPKIFFIQACQGVRSQECVPVESDACNAFHNNMGSNDDLIPGEADFLLGMATTCLAFRDPNQGSWYIQSLCRELSANYHRGEDILSILIKVNEQVSKRCTQSTTQMPQPWTTLSRKLVFN